jgi:hypothetical protein
MPVPGVSHDPFRPLQQTAGHGTAWQDTARHGGQGKEGCVFFYLFITFVFIFYSNFLLQHGTAVRARKDVSFFIYLLHLFFIYYSNFLLQHGMAVRARQDVSYPTAQKCANSKACDASTQRVKHGEMSAASHGVARVIKFKVHRPSEL